MPPCSTASRSWSPSSGSVSWPRRRTTTTPKSRARHLGLPGPASGERPKRINGKEGNSRQRRPLRTPGPGLAADRGLKLSSMALWLYGSMQLGRLFGRCFKHEKTASIHAPALAVVYQRGGRRAKLDTCPGNRIRGTNRVTFSGTYLVLLFSPPL